MKIKAILSFVIVFALCFSLVGCGNRIKKEDAKETVEAFLQSVQDGNYEEAKKLLHPDRPFDIEKYFNSKEAEYGIDFQKGIEIKAYTEYSSSLYDSEVDGSDYELELNILVDGFVIELSVDLVKNDLGYGIYDLDIDR